MVPIRQLPPRLIPNFWRILLLFLHSLWYEVAMPEPTAQQVRHRVFPQRPSDKEIERYVEEILSTSTPEEISDLHQGPIPPDEPFRKLRQITLKRSRRADGEMAFCPRCGRHKQYLEGWLIYLPGLEALACVGNDCAGSEAKAEADREYLLEIQRKNNNDYLLETVPTLSLELAKVEALKPSCEAADTVYRTFKREGKEAWQALRNVVRDDGRLKVNEVMASNGIGPSGIRTSGGSTQTRSISFGELRGRTMFKGAFTPLKAVGEIEATIQEFECQNDDALLEMATWTHDQMEAACRSLRKAFEGLSRLDMELKDIARFFATSNLEAITRWSSHHDAAFRGLRFSRRRANGREVAFFQYSNPSRFKEFELPDALTVPD